MKMLLMGSSKFIKNKVTGFVLGGMLMLPAAAFSQEQRQDDQEEQSSRTQEEREVRVPTTGSSTPWQNSAASSIGTTTNGNANSSTARQPARPGTSARPLGASTDGRDPGGNPDVPFDDNMNLGFLAAGIVFALIVARKRFTVKPLPVSSK